MHIIIGIIIIAIGAFIVIKTEAILGIFGRIAFFERTFGTEGGSRLGYKIVGVFFIFIGILVLTNMIGGFMEWVLSPLLKYNR
jgi:hypothetical protein